MNTFLLASQASLKNQLLEAIYTDNTYMLSEVLAKTETSKGVSSPSRKPTAIKSLTPTVKVLFLGSFIKYSFEGYSN